MDRMSLSSNTKPYHHRQSERGNVLIFILLAIALLAAITMVLSRSNSASDETGNVERGRVLASQMMRFARAVEAGVQQLKFSDISENDISFENTVTATDYSNANCTNNRCRVFHINGAGLTLSAAPPSAISGTGKEWGFTGANAAGSAADPVGSTANDLVMFLPGVRNFVCREINKLLGVNNGDIPTDTDGIVTTAYTGAFSGSNLLDGDPTPFDLGGEASGCFYDDNASENIFYHTLIKR